MEVIGCIIVFVLLYFISSAIARSKISEKKNYLMRIWLS
jgi:hypothetical protein